MKYPYAHNTVRIQLDNKKDLTGLYWYVNNSDSQSCVCYLCVCVCGVCVRVYFTTKQNGLSLCTGVHAYCLIVNSETDLPDLKLFDSYYNHIKIPRCSYCGMYMLHDMYIIYIYKLWMLLY